MILNATWSIHDERGELVAQGVHAIDIGPRTFFSRPVQIDAYEPSLAIANAVEAALNAYLPCAQRGAAHPARVMAR